jgi:hypothetical protein
MLAMLILLAGSTLLNYSSVLGADACVDGVQNLTG